MHRLETKVRGRRKISMGGFWGSVLLLKPEEGDLKLAVGDRRRRRRRCSLVGAVVPRCFRWSTGDLGFLEQGQVQWKLEIRDLVMAVWERVLEMTSTGRRSAGTITVA